MMSATSIAPSVTALRSHYSARELAELKLVGLPGSERGVRFAAVREQWPTRPRAKGKGVEYAPPAAVLAQLQGRSTAHPANIARQPTGAHGRIAEARHAVLSALDALMRHTACSRKQAASLLLEMARQGVADATLLRQARDPRGRPSADGLPSVRSLLRFADYRSTGALTPKRRQPDLSMPDWAGAFLAQQQHPDCPSIQHAYRRFAATWPQPAPSIWQVRRFLSRFKHNEAQPRRPADLRA